MMEWRFILGIPWLLIVDRELSAQVAEVRQDLVGQWGDEQRRHGHRVVERDNSFLVVL
jgi:hypothetical protein